MLSQYYQEELGLKGASGLGVSTPRELNLPPPLLPAPSSGYGDGVLHPKISEVWSLFFRQLPNFSDSYRILQTAIEFYQQLPIFSDEKRPFFPDIFLRSYLRTAAHCLGTSPPLSPISTPRFRPPTPRTRPPIWPGRPRRAPLPAAGRLQETTEFYRQNHRILQTELPNFTDRHRNYPTELPNFTDRHRNYPTELTNFADRHRNYPT